MEKIKKSTPITIVGCGPGSLSYLTPLAKNAIKKAEVLVGGKRLLELFPEVAAEKIFIGKDIEPVLEEIQSRLGKKKITVLVSGDPGLCSFAKPLMKRFGRDSCEVVPGISSIQVAFAHIGIDWFDAKIISAHNGDPNIKLSSLKDSAKIAILTRGKDTFLWLSDVAHFLGKEYRVFICKNLTLQDEDLFEISVSELKPEHLILNTIVLFIREELFL